MDTGFGTGSWEDVRVGHEADFLEECFAGTVRDETDECAKRDGDESEGEGYAPFAATNPGDGEGGSSDEYDENLNHDF